MDDISPERLAAADRRLAAIDRRIDQLVWNWRLVSHECPDEQCRPQDRTRDSITFCDGLVNQLGWGGDECELITVLVRRLKDVTPVIPPGHLWKAGGGCSCGADVATEQEWVEHAGSDCLIVPWYAER